MSESLSKRAIAYLKLVFGKPNKIEQTESSYNSLSPIANADQDNHYFDAISWALTNRKEKDIKNIAITGPYGSGKSSILKTFQTRNKDKELHFLNISLATFKEEEVKIDSEPEDILRLIELSILQQIFYHEEDDKIPDSRFAKIKTIKQSKLNYISFAIVLTGLSIINVIFPKLLQQQLPKIKISTNADIVIHYLALFIVIAGLIFFIFKSARFFSSLKLEKFKIQDAEIKISDAISKSILNQHLDEILYFFEVTSYNVVIIEDLDRFKQTEIFTKLRELNLLINNSKKTKKDVVFIYAVRDEMFKDKDRTKFFDFIIPIIPVINSSNSNEILSKNLKQNNYNISDDLIDDISLFIDDMRLLINIVNEYNIYHQQLNKQLNQNNLLSIIVYKNIYPNDFIDLSNNEGHLYGILINKRKFIANEKNKIDEKILYTRNIINDIESTFIKNIKELRSLYILYYIGELKNISSFIIGGTSYSLNDVLNDEVFLYFQQNSVNYNSFFLYYSNYSQTTQKVTILFKSVQEAVDPNYTYKEREKQIIEWNHSKTEIQRIKIVQFESEKTKLKSLTLKEVISKYDLPIELEDKKQSQLLSILLRNGYIDEDYLDYISIFYEGSISKDDNQYILNVKTKKEADFGLKLTKYENIIKKISNFDFAKKYILNYSLFDFLLESNEYDDQLKSIFTLLKDESASSISFIDNFLETSKNTESFILKLCNSWPNIWNFINTQSSFIEEKKVSYLKMIIQYSNIDDIILIATRSNLCNDISEMEDFLSIIENKEKLTSVIQNIQIKFRKLKLDENVIKLSDFIFNGNYYEISKAMLLLMISIKGSFNQVDFETKNYFAINTSDCPRLIKYINENIEKYITEVYLKLEANNDEPEEYLIEILNNKDIKVSSKISVIRKVKNKINDIGNVTSIDIHDILFEESKVEPIWENLIFLYIKNENKFTQPLLTFLNNEQNAIKLSKVDISTEIPESETADSFIASLILQQGISNNNYIHALKAVPYAYQTLAFESLSIEKVALLIEYNLLSLNADNFNKLKKGYKDLYIVFIERNFSTFIKEIKSFILDKVDVLKILKSSRLSIIEKSNFITLSDESTIINNLDILTLIGELILFDPSLESNEQIVKYILIKGMLSTKQKIIIFNAKANGLENNEILNVIATLPSPFSNITINGKRPLIEKSDDNYKFIEILKSKEIISNYEEKDNGIRIFTFTNNNTS